jgi:hypothetical protein
MLEVFLRISHMISDIIAERHSWRTIVIECAISEPPPTVAAPAAKCNGNGATANNCPGVTTAPPSPR